jgi:hypothetical protein
MKGDCYMAATGIPEPKADHAVVMCEFARECLKKMKGLCKDLEILIFASACILVLPLPEYCEQEMRDSSCLGTA